MKFSRYPKYKDSGVEWLGEVPAHWTLPKIKHIATFCGGGTPSRETAAYWNGDIPWVSPKDMKSERIIGAEESITGVGLTNSSSSLVATGAALLVVRSGILKHTIPVAINDVPVALNQDMKAIRFSAESCLSAFFLRWVQGLNNALLLAWAKQGATVESIEHDYFAETILPLPPVHEQGAIAAFLDRETGKTDALIAEQEKLIALLKEKRQALISHAVTKGLDPNAPMKDSGIEWLGRVPAHWDVLPVWLLFELGRGKVISHEEIAAHEGPFPVYSSQTENDGEMGRIDTYDFDGAYLTWTTDGANAGTVFRRSGRFNCTNVCGTLKAKSPGIDLGYMVCALGASTSAFVRLDINPKLMNNVMARIRVPVPPELEQQEISALIAERTSGLNKLMQEAARAIELLKERRAVLISAAVTGKIDVRDPAVAEAHAEATTT